MTKTVATEPYGWPAQASSFHYARESICQGVAVRFVRERVFVLNILALRFGFVSDFVLRI
jgi:hypothetical protein